MVTELRSWKALPRVRLPEKGDMAGRRRRRACGDVDKGAGDHLPIRHATYPSYPSGRLPRTPGGAGQRAQFVLERRQDVQIVEDLPHGVKVILQRGRARALPPGLGAVVVVRLHLVAGGFQVQPGLREERLPAGTARQGGERGGREQTLGLLFGVARLGAACAVGALLGGVISDICPVCWSASSGGALSALTRPAAHAAYRRAAGR